jgi:hypothetical protein
MEDFSAWVEQHKGLWARVYDEVIQPDLEKEWKKSMYCQLTRRSSLRTYQERRSIRSS